MKTHKEVARILSLIIRIWSWFTYGVLGYEPDTIKMAQYWMLKFEGIDQDLFEESLSVEVAGRIEVIGEVGPIQKLLDKLVDLSFGPSFLDPETLVDLEERGYYIYPQLGPSSALIIARKFYHSDDYHRGLSEEWMEHTPIMDFESFSSVLDFLIQRLTLGAEIQDQIWLDLFPYCSIFSSLKDLYPNYDQQVKYGLDRYKEKEKKKKRGLVEQEEPIPLGLLIRDSLEEDGSEN